MPCTLLFGQNWVVGDGIWLEPTGQHILYTWWFSTSSMINDPWRKLSSITHFFTPHAQSPWSIYISHTQKILFSWLSDLSPSSSWSTWCLHHYPWAYIYSNLRRFPPHIVCTAQSYMHWKGFLFLSCRPTPMFACSTVHWFLAGLSSQPMYKLSISLLHQLFIMNSPRTTCAC